MKTDNVVTPRHYRPGDTTGLHRPGDRVAPMHSVLLAHGSFVRTLEDAEGNILAVFGAMMRWPGVADVWAVVGDSARGKGLPLTRTARRLLDQFVTELEIRRLGAYVRADQREYQRWIRVLGFKLEGVEEQAAPDGGDILRYRRLTWTHRAAQKLQ